jgi:CrcB protein
VTWLAVAALGAAGSLLRFRVDTAVQRRVAGEFPLGTFAVNVSGSFALGLATGLGLTGDALLLVGTGFLGSYTTFSTWMLETERLAEEGDGRLAAANVVLSLASGVAAAGVGWALGAVL